MPKADASTDDAICRIGQRVLANGWTTHLAVWAAGIREGIDADPSTVWRALANKPDLFEIRAFDRYFRVRTP